MGNLIGGFFWAVFLVLLIFGLGFGLGSATFALTGVVTAGVSTATFSPLALAASLAIRAAGADMFIFFLDTEKVAGFFVTDFPFAAAAVLLVFAAPL